MNKLKPLFWILIVCCMSEGCGRYGGEKSFEFLKGVHDGLENTKTELRQYSYPKPPLLPDLSGRMTRRDRLAEIKKHHNDFSLYLNTVIQNSQQMERILNDAETKMSGLDSAGVELDAINLTRGYENSLGDQVQVFIEIEALAKLEETKLSNAQQSNLIATMIPGIIETAVTDNPTFAVRSFLGGVSRDVKHDIERNQEAQSHLTLLGEAVTTLKHDVTDVITKRSELVTAFDAKYPKFPWSEILPAAAQTNTRKSN